MMERLAVWIGWFALPRDRAEAVVDPNALSQHQYATVEQELDPTRH